MNGLKEALEYIVDLKEPDIITSNNGILYSDKKLYRVEKFHVESIKVKTLTAVVDYINNKLDDNLNNDNLFIHICDYNHVKLLTMLDNEEDRTTYINSVNEGISIHFDRFMDRERFNIMLQSCFVPTDDSELILSYIGNMTDSAVRTIGDDGVSQEVTIKQATKGLTDVVIPNPVTLKPYRTFKEIDQPESKFIFRVDDNGNCGLFEADGGAWKLDAINTIKEFLKENIEAEINILA